MILAEELGELLRRIAPVPEVDEDLRHRLRRARALAAGLDPYLEPMRDP
jgi:hypothetical protein